MVTTNMRCDGCGKVLASPDAVCTDCAAKIRAELDAPPQGKHPCPVCAGRFDRPRHELWPAGAKWYVPRQLKPTCPQCRSFLRDNRYPALPAHLVWLLIVTALAAWLVLPATYTRGALVVLLIAYLILHLRERKRNKDAASRYSRDEA